MTSPTQRIPPSTRQRAEAGTASADVREGAAAVASVIALPLREEEEKEPARWRWSTSLTANPDAHRNARLRVRPALHVANWPGNSDAATRLTSVLVGNAAAHAEPMSNGMIPLRLVELKTGELAIEVDDGTPEFPNFEKAREEAKTGNGLWWVSHYQGRISWDLLRDDSGSVVGKTVQVILPVAWGESA